MLCKKALIVLFMIFSTPYSGDEKGKNSAALPQPQQRQVAAASLCVALLDSKCTVCHYAARICQEVGKKSKRGWKRTINNMAARGARLTAAEKRILAECLARPDKEINAFCR